MSDAKEQSQQVGGTQGQIGRAQNDGDRSQVADRDGSTSGSIPQRVSGGDSAESFEVGFVLGGILSQLVLDAENRLAETRECIEWYEREAKKCEKRLEQLRTLTASLQGGEE